MKWSGRFVRIALLALAIRVGIDVTANWLFTDPLTGGWLIRDGVFAAVLALLFTQFPDAFRSKSAPG